MRFEIKDKTGRVVMWTVDVCCVPSAGLLSAMRAAGYKTYLDGRLIRKRGIAGANCQ